MKSSFAGQYPDLLLGNLVSSASAKMLHLPLHPGEWQVLCRCAGGWILVPNITTRRSNQADLHLLLTLDWHWRAQGLLIRLHKWWRRGEAAQMDLFSITILTSA